MFNCFSINETQVKRLMYHISTNNDELNDFINGIDASDINNSIEEMKRYLSNKKPGTLSPTTQFLMKYILMYDKTKIVDLVLMPIISIPWSGPGRENNTCWLVSSLAVLSSMTHLLNALSESKNENCMFLFDILLKLRLGIQNSAVKKDFIDKYYSNYSGTGEGLIFTFVYNYIFDDNAKSVVLLINTGSIDRVFKNDDFHVAYMHTNSYSKLPEYVLIQHSIRFDKLSYDEFDYNKILLFHYNVDPRKLIVKRNIDNQDFEYSLFAIVIGTGIHYYPIFFNNNLYSEYCIVDAGIISNNKYDIFKTSNEITLLCYVRTNNKIEAKYNSSDFPEVQAEEYLRFHKGYVPHEL